jgi:transcriptional regulator with XRE-family HTH domain
VAGQPWSGPLVADREPQLAHRLESDVAVGIRRDQIGAAVDSTSRPSALGLVLGAHLRTLREMRGLSREEVAGRVGASIPALAMLEQGHGGLDGCDVAALLSLYGVRDPGERIRIAAVADELARSGEWRHHSDTVPLASWLQTYLGLEAAAELIRIYELAFVPALLQTADYFKCRLRVDPAQPSNSEIERRLRRHLARQQILSGDHPARVWAVVEESALRRLIGGPAVMRAQIQALIHHGERPGVAVQIIPLDSEVSCPGRGFSLLRFDDPDVADVACLGHGAAALYLDRRDDLDHYTQAMERLCDGACHPNETPTILRRLLRKLDR